MFLRCSLVLQLIGAIAFAANVSAEDFMFRVLVGDREIEGQPLHWDSSQMLVMTRDGQLEEFDPRTATKGKKTSPQFVPYSSSETRQKLLEEFGSGFRVTASEHYLVAHPASLESDWATRFESLYRQFQNYFRVRGFDLSSPQVPLVAVIFPTRDDYTSYVRQAGTGVQESTLGHYDPRSNRVLMYDQRSDGEYQDGTLSTIIHEATHQTAYNTGLHSRLTATPRWLVEGLAMMFEVHGVNGTATGIDREQRIHQGRLQDFRDFLETKRGDGVLRQLVASDHTFDTDPVAAYAQAWALSFYLAETRPREYESYLKLTAARPPLASYPPRTRVDDFSAIFGDNLTQLEAEFLRWIDLL
jgi:hypothetical protein